jgi:radical SAM/Cys-rich protein
MKSSRSDANSDANSQANFDPYPSANGNPVPQAKAQTKALTLQRRRSPLADPTEQLRHLDQLSLPGGNFGATLAQHHWPQLTPAALEIFQINLGKLCNMTCKHCHVDAGPDRTRENMDRATVEDCLIALDKTQAHTVDLTGGAPELNPHFRDLVDALVARGKQIIDRCNLTVLLLPNHQDLPQWLADRGVEVVCSLPHYRSRNTDAQRGDGTFEQSIEALRRLNRAGYGQGDPQRRLTLVSNPVGAFLAPSQGQIQREWQHGLAQNHGVSFDRLICLNNMPISRYLEWLEQSGNLSRYMELLVNAFNPATLSGLMCRNTISISWDGRVFDCDFNQMLELEANREGSNLRSPETADSRDKARDIEASQARTKETFHIRDFDPIAFSLRQIVTARHCFGCTAGSGSSCGGNLD